jgi:hypothetical protein
LAKAGGSASAIKSAYWTMEDSDRVGTMGLAAWIVDHLDNDYIPFPTATIRHAPPANLPHHSERPALTVFAVEQVAGALGVQNAAAEGVVFERALHQRGQVGELGQFR